MNRQDALNAPEFLLLGGELTGEIRAGQELLLKGREHRHLALSKRMRPGETVRVGDGAGLVAICRVREIGRDTTRLEVIELLGPLKDTLPLHVVLSLIKAERMDWAVQKLSEIGVEAILPVVTERSVARPGAERAERRRSRWQKVALEALKQSRGAAATRIGQILPLKDMLLHLAEGQGLGGGSTGLSCPLVVLHAGAAFPPLWEMFDVAAGSDRAGAPFGSCFVVVGPEGGFSPDEIGLFERFGAGFASLGTRILRSETAAVVAAGIFAARYFSMHLGVHLGGRNGK